MGKIAFIKWMDCFLVRPLLCLIPNAPELSLGVPDKPGRILFIRPGGIGDFVLLVPAIEAVRSRYPGASIELLCELRNVGISRFIDGIDKVHVYDDGLSLLQIFRKPYDIVIDTEQSHHTTALLTYMLKAPVKIGYDTNDRRKAYTHRIPYSHDDYETDSFENLVRPIIGPSPHLDHTRPFIKIDTERARRFLPVSSSRSTTIISIFPGATVAERRWPAERFGAVAAALAKQGHSVVILGARNDTPAASSIRTYAPEAIDTTGKTDLVDVASILKASAVMLTADSGLMHLAVGVGTPVVALFGSGMERKWGPRSGRDIIINKHLDCSPCTRFGYTQACKRGYACLQNISVEEVCNSVNIILKRGRP